MPGKKRVNASAASTDVPVTSARGPKKQRGNCTCSLCNASSQDSLPYCRTCLLYRDRYAQKLVAASSQDMYNQQEDVLIQQRLRLPLQQQCSFFCCVCYVGETGTCKHHYLVWLCAQP
eukprot:4450681-Amphidinium_carterae.1